MDLGVVGRHVLLFDDDDMAAFVNSGDALVDWHSLQIDRYDVRHLLSSAPPPRRRNRNSRPARLDDLSLESQLDQERYLDLPSHPDEPDVKEDELRTDAHGYRAVSFLYGENDDIVDKKNADAGMESSGFLPSFSIPSDLQSLPPTEKVHQIIARTALFVSKHGGQSEIILRVKQGDNPTFGFLMPGHHLHAYFRFLVEHPELVHSESDGKFQDKQKFFATDHNESNGVDGALTLLGSVYGSEEEDDGGDNVKAEKDYSTYSPNHSISHSSKEIESQADAAKDESMSENPIPFNREKVLTVKKNSLITTSKSGTAKCMEEKSHLFYGAADRAKSLTMGMTLKVETETSEPPPELKRLIDKLVELIMRNGKQFELTLMEEDSKHERFSFLRPSDQYHSYYSKVLQTAVRSKLNCKGLNSGKDGPLGRGVEKKATALEEMPLKSNRKEKFKMVIGKSKKETQETESKEAQQECGIDATAAAAILQAATRGINGCNLQIISVTPSTAHVNNSEDGLPRDFGNSLSSTTDHAVQKLGQSRSCNISAVEADSEARLTKEQKLKADRLKRAKMFVAMLKSGEVPFTNGISRASSLEPLESGVSRPTGEVNVDCKKREASLASPDIDGPGTDEKPERNYFGEHNERLSKRKYRSRSGLCESEDAEDDGDKRKHNGRHSKRKCRSRSRRRDESDENNNAIETERKHHRERHSSPFSSDENENEETSEEDREHKRYRVKHLCHDQRVDEYEDKYKNHKNHKCTRKKHHKRRRRTHSYADESEDEREEGGQHNRYKSKHGSHFHEEDEFHDEYKEDKNHKHRRKKHHSHSRKRHSPGRVLQVEDEIHEKRSGTRHHSSHGRSREKHRHSHRVKESQRKLKCDTSSCDEHQNPSHVDKHNDESIELEEGEISSSISEGSRGIAKRYISLEASTDVPSSHPEAPSQPSETSAGVPDDLRAKIRAMLMSTRL